MIITFVLYEVRRRKFSVTKYFFGDSSGKSDKMAVQHQEPLQIAKPTLEISSSSSDTEPTTESKNSTSSSYSNKEEKSS